MALMPPTPPPDVPPDWMPLVRAHVESLRFGVVQLIVHEGRVTQIERTEKVRLVPPPPSSSKRTDS